MPLNTQVIRDGKPLELGWSQFHVAAMAVAAAIDGPLETRSSLFTTEDKRPAFGFPDDESVPAEWRGRDQTSYPEVPCPITVSDAVSIATYGMLALTPLNHGRYVLKERHRFVDCTDGEVFELLPGDELVAFRD